MGSQDGSVSLNVYFDSLHELTFPFLRVVHHRRGHYDPYRTDWLHNYAGLANDDQAIHPDYAGTTRYRH